MGLCVCVCVYVCTRGGVGLLRGNVMKGHGSIKTPFLHNPIIPLPVEKVGDRRGGRQRVDEEALAERDENVKGCSEI